MVAGAEELAGDSRVTLAVYLPGARPPVSARMVRVEDLLPRSEPRAVPWYRDTLSQEADAVARQDMAPLPELPTVTVEEPVTAGGTDIKDRLVVERLSLGAPMTWERVRLVVVGSWLEGFGVGISMAAQLR